MENSGRTWRLGGIELPSLRSRGVRWAVILAVVGLLLGHVAYSYLPRERATVPDLNDLPGRLAIQSSAPVRVWIPYPHQNLASLARAVEDPRGFLAAAARIGELPPPILPSFGPFAVPPSRELTVVYDPEQDSFYMAARIYPVIAVVARVAGWLASNPWLQGGEVTLGENRAQVAWQGGLWTLSSAERPALDGSRFPGGQPALGLLCLSESTPPFLAGTYLLERQSGDLRLRLAAGDATAIDSLDAGGPWIPESEIILFAVSGAGGPLGEDSSAVAFLKPAGDGVARLPGAAVLSLPGERRFPLPAENLAPVLGLRLYEGQADGWRLLALDAKSLKAAETLAPLASDLIRGDASASFGLWLDPRGFLVYARRWHQILEQIPLVSHQDVQYWRDVETVLTPLQSLGGISLRVAAKNRTLELRLHRQVDKPGTG